uniref:Uncharacterized protein n=1 Tax=Cannabis sativa TaxID=3483 RepID=A0A803NMR2_CANSA
MEAIEESTQLSDSMRQAVALLADEDVDENSTSSSSPRRDSTFLNVVALGNVIKINDTEVEKEIKVVKRTIPTSFLDVDLIEIAEVFVAEENIDSTEGPKWFKPIFGNLLPVRFDNESFGCLSSHPSLAFRTTMIWKDNVYERKFVKLLPYSSRNTASDIVKVWAFSVDLAQEGGGTSTFSKQTTYDPATNKALLQEALDQVEELQD